jgi:hypothetical protein
MMLAACGSIGEVEPADATVDGAIVPDAAPEPADARDASPDAIEEAPPPARAFALDLDEDGRPETDAELIECAAAPSRTCLQLTTATGARSIPFSSKAPKSIRAVSFLPIGKHFGGSLAALSVYVANNAAPWGGATAMIVDTNEGTGRVVAFASASNQEAAFFNTYYGALRGPDGKRYPFVLPGAGYIHPASGQTPSTLGCVFDPSKIGKPDPACYTGFRAVETAFAQADVGGFANASYTYRHNGGWLQDLDGDGWEDIHLPYLWVTRTLSGRTGQPIVTTTFDVAAGIAPAGFHSGRQYGLFRSFVSPSGRPSVLITAGIGVGSFGDYYCGVSRYTALLEAAPGAPTSRRLRWSNYASFVKSALVAETPTPQRPGDGMHGCVHHFGDGVLRTRGVEVAIHDRFEAVAPAPNCAAEQWRDLVDGTPDVAYGPCAKSSMLPTRGTWRVLVQGLADGAGLTAIPRAYAWGIADRLVRGRTVLLVEPVAEGARFDRVGWAPQALQVVELLPPSGAETWRWEILGRLPVTGRPSLGRRDLRTGPVGASYSPVLDPVTRDVDGDGLDEIEIVRPDETKVLIGVDPKGAFVIKSD